MRSCQLGTLRARGLEAKLRSDPQSIVLIGHSMGGFVALQTGSLDPGIRTIVNNSAADLGTSSLQTVPANMHDLAVSGLASGFAAEGMAPLAGTTAVSLANEALANAARWNFVSLAPKLENRPVVEKTHHNAGRLLVITSNDGLTAANDAFVEAARKYGDEDVIAVHIFTDHSYSDHRIALEQVVLDALTRFEPR